MDTRKLLMIASLFAVLGLSACNTTKGIGQDVQSVGGAVEDAAD